MLNRGHHNGTIKQGYLVVLRDGRRTGEHVFTAEKTIGRRLRTDEEVHHLNEKRMDNRAENLLIMLKKDHRKLTGILRNRASLTKKLERAKDKYELLRIKYQQLPKW